MTHQEESLLAERQNAFLRQLPRRVDVIGRRFQRFMSDGWDINGLALVHEDSSRLARSCERHGLAEAHASLGSLSSLLAQTLQQQVLPDPALAERLQHLIEDLRDSVPAPPDGGIEPMAPRSTGAVGRAEAPPHGYWRRWGDDAPAPVMVVERTAPPSPNPAAPKTEEADPWGHQVPRFGSLNSSAALYGKTDLAETPAPPAPAAVPERAPSPAPAASTQSPAPDAQPTAPPGKSLQAGLRAYHLSDSNAISVELDQLLEAQGVELEVLDDDAELKELLGAIPADLVLVDASFSDALEAIGDAIRQSRLKTSQRVLLVAISEAEDITLKLVARRAGADALVSGAGDASAVMQRLRQLFEAGKEAPYRILIVEDDRSQALFAEGILRNAGMESMVVLDAMQVMPALEKFQPEMILMDLHMPKASGIELTALIRDQPDYLHTPIVFLSGENDADRQFDAIDAGGDDFLSKPIRPRHLVAAVQSRVRRHRAMAQRSGRASAPGHRSTGSGLHHRADLIERIDRALAAGEKRGGVLFLEIEGLNLLRERLGLSALEQVLAEFARLLADSARDQVAARFGDGSYFLLDDTLDEAGLETLALQVRGKLVQHPFQAQGQALRLRVSVGICPLRQGYPDAAALLNAVEQSAREARALDKGVKRHQPTASVDAAREARLAADIRDALVRRRFELYYQPVVAVAGSDDSQYQALLRMHDPAGRLRSAAEIVPVAERAGSILDIDRWVVSEALGLIRERHAEGRALRLFVTQSALTLADEGQAAWLRSALARAGVPGSSLVIEIRTQDAALNLASLRQFCSALVSDGVLFCLSQFSAGSDVEPLLQQLPLAFVKLAHKYTASSADHALRDELKLLIGVAHRRGLEVIGHGVEDAQAAATLWMSGIDFIQGNLVQQAEQDLDFDFHQAVL